MDSSGPLPLFELLLDLHQCDRDRIDDVNFINRVMSKVAKKLKYRVLDTASYRFHPQGVTSMLLLAESHLTFHSYPEKGAAFINLLSCSSHQKDLQSIVPYLSRKFGAQCHIQRVVERP